MASQKKYITKNEKKEIKTMATQKTKKKYVVTINEVSGTLDNDLFKKMLKAVKEK